MLPSPVDDAVLSTKNKVLPQQCWKIPAQWQKQNKMPAKWSADESDSSEPSAWKLADNWGLAELRAFQELV